MSEKPKMEVVLSARGAGTQKLEVGSYKEAAAAWEHFRDRNDLGASMMNRNCGSIYIDNKKVGYVSYNGRVWNNKDEEIDVNQCELVVGTAINAADTTYALVSAFNSFTKDQKLFCHWELHQTGGFCMVATCEVKLVDGRTVSLGVTNECVCLYTYSWLKEPTEEEFNSDTIFDWHRGTNPVDLINKLKQDLVQPDHYLLFEEIMTVMHSDHF